MLIDDRAALYLKTLAEDGRFPGGLSFRKALAQSRLDYSLESLDRIDHLLDQVRVRFNLEVNTFLEKSANQTFLYLLAFYVGNVVARVSKLPIKWQEYADLAASYPLARAEFPESFITSVSCALGGGALFLPLAPMVRRLFEPSIGGGVRESANKFIVNQDAMLAFRRPRELAATPALFLPLAHALHLAGVVSALMVAEAAAGRLVPVFGTILPNGESVITRLVYASLEGAISTGLERLQTNPEGAKQWVFAYDAFVKLAAGRTDALVVEVRADVVPAFAVSLVVPYRPANHRAGFAVYRVKLMSSNADDDLHLLLMDHFYNGVHEAPQAAQIWRSCLDESV